MQCYYIETGINNIKVNIMPLFNGLYNAKKASI
jgi:hypothetical protein